MLKAAIVLVLSVVSMAVELRGQGVSAKSNDTAAIAALVGEMESGWNAKNGAQFAMPFAEDADYVVINGVHIKGRSAIAQGHQQIFDTVFRKSTLKTTVERSRLLTADIAIVHVRSDLTVGEGSSVDTRSGRIMLILSRNRGNWEIEAFQNTSIGR